VVQFRSAGRSCDRGTSLIAHNGQEQPVRSNFAFDKRREP